MALVTDANTLNSKNNKLTTLVNEDESDIKSESSSTDDGK